MSLSLLPWRNKQSLADPFETLHEEMNRAIEQFGKDFSAESAGVSNWTPKVDISETEKEIQVAAELPGVEEKDVEVSIDNGVLSIKGEKKAEKEEKDKNYYRVERSYGSFQRMFTLPKEVEQEKVEASFKKGVLTVKLPKTWEAQNSSKKIAIKNN